MRLEGDRRQLAKRSVAAPNDFVNLVKLMFSNARSFNAPYTVIHAAAVRLRAEGRPSG